MKLVSSNYFFMGKIRRSRCPHCDRIKLAKKNLIQSMLYLVNDDDVSGLPGSIHIMRECEQQC